MPRTMLHAMSRLENKQKNLMVVQILEGYLKCSELTEQPWGGRKGRGGGGGAKLS